MGRLEKLCEVVLSGRADANVRFDDLRFLLARLGFDERVLGSHHIFVRSGVDEILNVRPRSGGMAKPYQVNQVRDVIRKYGMEV